MAAASRAEGGWWLTEGGGKVGNAVEDGASGEDNGQRKLLLRPSDLETGSFYGACPGWVVVVGVGGGWCSKQPRKGRIAKP